MSDDGRVDDGDAGESPFVTLWEAPRATIRRIVRIDPRSRVTALFFAQGLLGAINSAMERAATGEESPGAIGVRFLVTIVLAVPVSYVSAWYLRWIATWFGGKGSRAAVAASVAWATLPSIVGTAVILATRLALFGPEVFRVDQPTVAAASPLLTTTLSIAPIFFALWSGYLSVVCLAEVSGFSTTRAVLTHLTALVLAIVVIAVPIVVLTLGLLASG